MVTKTKREKLHGILCDILESKNCYFSPPSSIQLNYPCFIYNAEGERTRHADNIRYFHRTPYSLTLIDADPESEIAERLFNSNLMYLRHDRTYVSDGLNHFVFTLYF